MQNDVHQPNYIYRQTVPIPEDTPKVRGYDFNQGVDHQALLQSFYNTGFQATRFGLAVNQINLMIEKRKETLGADNKSVDGHSSSCPCQNNCTIFLGYTSNLISSGVRETIRFLVQHKKVDVLVTTAGGIEEDLIKCLGPFYLGDFSLSGKDLYKKGLNRIGNLLMPDRNYIIFEKWIFPIFKKMLLEQETQGAHWTPSKMIHRFGKEIDNTDSVCYWAYKVSNCSATLPHLGPSNAMLLKNNIPIFSPALTDGALGDMLYLFSHENPGLRLDITQDITRINNMAVAANNTGIIILGGGVAKHHICNANAFRCGADFAVFVNTGQEADGSDSGARPDEAVTWGKIKMEAAPVKIFADATLIFPLLVSQTFAAQHDKITNDTKN